MYHPDTNASPMDNLKRTGGHGRKKNTGISTNMNTSTNIKEKKGMMWNNGNINKVKVEAKENTTIRS